MTTQEGKEKFIQSWGALGTSWGINRTMAQIHALLLISSQPLCADEIMEALKISRGNTNMNLRALMDWALVFKELKAGERREFFVAEKDMWQVVRNIILNRKKKELEPTLRVLDELSSVEGDDPEPEEFTRIIKEILLFSNKTDSLPHSLNKADPGWLMNSFIKMIK